MTPDLTPNQWATREDVRDLGLNLQNQVDRRFTEQRERRDERDKLAEDRHRENVSRMDTILSEVRETNGRVIVLEDRHKSLAEEFQAIRKRWHDFRDSIQNKLSEHRASDAITGENRQITMRDVYMFCGGFGIFYGIAKIMKWIP